MGGLNARASIFIDNLAFRRGHRPQSKTRSQLSSNTKYAFPSSQRILRKRGKNENKNTDGNKANSDATAVFVSSTADIYYYLHLRA